MLLTCCNFSLLKLSHPHKYDTVYVNILVAPTSDTELSRLLYCQD